MVESYVWKGLIAYAFFFAVGITSVAVANGQTEHTCNNEDSFGMSLFRYLWAYGVTVLCFSLVVIPINILVVFCCGASHRTDCAVQSVKFFVGICFAAFFVYDVVWTILGGINIFHTNLHCLPGNSLIPICAILIWALNILFIVACVIIGIIYKWARSNSY
jgi:hypothetical protein